VSFICFVEIHAEAAQPFLFGSLRKWMHQSVQKTASSKCQLVNGQPIPNVPVNLGEIEGRAWYPRSALELDQLLRDLLPVPTNKMWLIRVPSGAQVPMRQSRIECGYACSLCASDVMCDELEEPHPHIVVSCACTGVLFCPRQLCLVPRERT